MLQSEEGGASQGRQMSAASPRNHGTMALSLLSILFILNFIGLSFGIMYTAYHWSYVYNLQLSVHLGSMSLRVWQMIPSVDP